MAQYKCTVCGYIYDEDKEGKPFDEIDACPLCKQPKNKFEPVEGTPAPSESVAAPAVPSEVQGDLDLSYDPAFARNDPSVRYMDLIHEMAVTGQTKDSAMGTQMKMPNWDDILLLGAQLDPAPLNDGEEVDISVTIGKHAKKPMVLGGPVYISHMSFGALSKEAKTALAKGTAMAGTAMCSGEGGVLPEEKAAADKYIFEYVPNKYSVTDEMLQSSDAIEIKIGQGTKPGMGGHLPGDKVTPEIAALRGKPLGEDVQSPSKFPEINSKEDLKDMVGMLRERSGGRPIGVKIAAGRIEQDMAFAVYAEPDFITVDGRGGATGSSPFLLKEATSVPTVYALHRARKYLDSINSDIQLVITGGLRVSADVAKAIAMGADAVAVATAGMIALGCQQYRICGNGMCPVGIATQDPELRKRLDVEVGAKRVGNFLKATFNELRTFARVTGHKKLADLNISDLATISDEIADHTYIPHA